MKILILGLMFCMTQAQNSQLIEWNENRLLSWNDFTGNVPNNATEAAQTYAGISYSSCDSYNENQDAKFTVTAFFAKNKSWVKQTNKTAYILMHEQLHFDLTEIYTRKLRQYFHENITTIKKSDKIYKQLFKEYTEMQQLYDKETNHGINNAQQALWSEKIKKLLENSMAYAENKCY